MQILHGHDFPKLYLLRGSRLSRKQRETWLCSSTICYFYPLSCAYSHFKLKISSFVFLIIIQYVCLWNDTGPKQISLSLRVNIKWTVDKPIRCFTSVPRRRYTRRYRVWVVYAEMGWFVVWGIYGLLWPCKEQSDGHVSRSTETPWPGLTACLNRYKNSTMGWSPRKKMAEMKESGLIYILLMSKSATVGFVSFMVTIEEDECVVYWYKSLKLNHRKWPRL
jgi:hypothetical protein